MGMSRRKIRQRRIICWILLIAMLVPLLSSILVTTVGAEPTMIFNHQYFEDEDDYELLRLHEDSYYEKITDDNGKRTKYNYTGTPTVLAWWWVDDTSGANDMGDIICLVFHNGDFFIRRWQDFLDEICPFDHTQAFTIEIIFIACVFHFFFAGNTVHIIMIQRQSAFIFIYNGKSRAGHIFCHFQTFCKALCENSFAYPQIAFNYNEGESFKEWAAGSRTEETIVCTVDTSQAALDLVSAGVGIALIPENCLFERKDVRFVSVSNWHQALYMCILYDKWLEPPIWAFVEKLVKAIRLLQSCR